MAVLFTACSKNKCDKSDPGLGGGGVITGAVKHHNAEIPSAKVYIKYGATEFPGADTSLYDDHKTASAADASFAFHDLKPGDYYLYGVGFDASISLPVTGGVTVEICGDEEEKKTNVPVTE